MKKISYLLLAFFLLAATSSSVTAISTDFLKRGGKHCTGYCDEASIHCWKGVEAQGYYDWCKNNCLHETKTNKEEFEKAISKCDAKNSTRWSNARQGACLSVDDIKTFLLNVFDKKGHTEKTEIAGKIIKNNLPDWISFESFRMSSPRNPSGEDGDWYALWGKISIKGKNLTLTEGGKTCSYVHKDQITNKTFTLKLRIK